MPIYHHVLATTDLSEASRAGLQEAARIAASDGSRLTVLLVIEDQLPPLMASSEEYRHELLDAAAERTRARLETFVHEAIPESRPEVVVATGTPSRTIVEEARRRGCDLVVMSSHGFGPLLQLLIGSTAERVLHRCGCPVLIVPARPGERD